MAAVPGSLFISLDGLDGTGKSTQCRLLQERLRRLGLSVTACVDPGGTELGARIREILLHGRQASMSMRCEALLFMASRAELVTQMIEPALARGEIVVCDRYLLANVVYQGHAGGLDVDDLWRIGNFSTFGIEPDLTIILDVPVETARIRLAGGERKAADRVESRGDDYFQRVRNGFLTEAARRPDRVRVIDAGSTLDVVQERLFSTVAEILRDRGMIREGMKP